MATAPEPVALNSSVLDAARRFQTGPASPLALWHLASFDAPTVAVVWTWFVGRCFHGPTNWPVLVGMFAAVWVLYACDRLLDSAAATRNDEQSLHGLERRHCFHALHRRRFVWAIAAAAALVCFCVPRLTLGELVMYLLLGAALSLWFGLVHGMSAARSLRLPKELAVGLFFPVAVSIPAFIHDAFSRVELLLPMMLFGLLCTINGLFIRLWEQGERGSSVSPKSDAGPLTRGLLRQLGAMTFACCLLPILLAATQVHWFIFTGAIPIEVAVALSAAALLTLNRLLRGIERTHLRALADLVLLSPLLLAPFVR